jgi:predicted enzyme related to lactoylglutathione lyase
MNRPVHFEILGDDPERLAAFYQAVFDWRIVEPAGSEKYWMVRTGRPDGTDEPGIDGGFMHRHFPQAVINTVMVDSLDDTIARLQAAGGTVRMGPHEIPGVGTHVYCADPEGNLFGVLQPVNRGQA